MSERTQDHVAIDGNIDTIDRALDHMKRIAADRSMRYANASEAGAAMAHEVARFLDDPEGVGTGALRAAYEAFMGRHSGNFCDLDGAVQS